MKINAIIMLRIFPGALLFFSNSAYVSGEPLFYNREAMKETSKGWSAEESDDELCAAYPPPAEQASHQARKCGLFLRPYISLL